jgi:pantoate--beta-alanine ligase
MFIFHSSRQMRLFLNTYRKQSVQIGFIPTMGALHRGHISLIETAKKQSLLTVASIFVNPTQFNDASDYQNYPITIAQDIKMLEQTGCDLLFMPCVNEIYTGGTQNLEHYELGYLETVLEGSFRPGHFQGVCQVMDRLLSIVEPNHLFMGQKDYQQCMVIKQLLNITGKSRQTKLHVCPTLREPDGLAMSSRNLRLGIDERKKAVSIFETLSMMKEEIKPGNIRPLKLKAAQQLTEKGFLVDYTEIADADSLELKDEWDGNTSLVALIAAFNGKVRLIDNMILTD